MRRVETGQRDVQQLLDAVGDSVLGAGTLYLAGETGQLLEGWLVGVPHLTVTCDTPEVADATALIADRMELELVWESPADTVPLPDGYEQRHRPTRYKWQRGAETLQVVHFDPYSVICRALARGDEPDYHLGLRYLEHDWVTESELVGRFEALIPLFTAETIAQDPAEFRRKFKGLLQMWRAKGRSGRSGR